MWTFVTDFFYIAQYFQNASMVQYVSVLHSLLQPKGYAIFHLSIHYLTGPLLVFYHLTVVDNDTMNILCIILMWAYVFVSLNHMPRGRIADQHGNSVSLFKQQPDHFPNCRATSHSHQQCLGDTLLHPSQHLFYWVFVIVGMKWLKFALS